MNREQREALKQEIPNVLLRVAEAERIADRREAVDSAGRQAVDALRHRHRAVGADGRRAWGVLPLVSDDAARLEAMARRMAQAPLTDADARVLRQLTETVPNLVAMARGGLGLRGLFAGREKKEHAAQAGLRLLCLVAAAGGSRLEQRLMALHQEATQRASSPSLGEALHPHVGLGEQLGLPDDTALLDYADFRRLEPSAQALHSAQKREVRLREAALVAGRTVRLGHVRTALEQMPVERLRDVTAGRLNLASLARAGITNVQQVLDLGEYVMQLPGIGDTTGTRILGAARTLKQTSYEEMPFRIDIKTRDEATTEFLDALRAWDSLRRTRASKDMPLIDDVVTAINHLAGTSAKKLLLTPGERPVSDFRRGAELIQALDPTLAKVVGARQLDPWQDFIARAADYYSLIEELGFITEDEDKTTAGLPKEVVEAVRRVELNLQHLRDVNLRGYQAFAARFVIAQRKVIIGDEMGLGKTVEALAVLAHLHAKGQRMFLVVCPAAIVSNWMREVLRKSTLRAHRLHGPERDFELRSWRRNGGVAVTTFDTLRWLQRELPGAPEIDCIVVDEAHYVKNPRAQRSQRTQHLLRSTERAMLMTGTPLENNTDEFRTLIEYIQPRLAIVDHDYSPRRFRQQVAPVYLRRNQEDVLTELPELVEVDEWIPMSPADRRRYIEAVETGNFMAMRQAAMLEGRESAKMQRLVEIVEEAEANDRRVIVFSYFRQVLDELARSLPGVAHGPLTGSVPADKRQQMVDSFSKARGGAVLVSQIIAGGVGLNIQAASVVVICEPQLKPTMEWQAIARARRLGQVFSVQVHRLLSEDSADQRIVEILAEKTQLFEDFARESDTALSAPEAFDISEADLTRQVLAEERERLLKGELPAAEVAGG